MFSKAAEEKIQQVAENPSTDDERKRAALLLQNTINVINQVDTLTHTLTHTEPLTQKSNSMIIADVPLCVF